MFDSNSPAPDAVARFYDNYLNCLQKASIPEKQRRWYVKRIEAFIKTHSGRKIKSLTDKEVSGYLEMTGGQDQLSGWQFVQCIDAIRILHRELLSTPACQGVDWEYWEEQPTKTFDELMVEYLKATEGKRSAGKDRQRCRTLRRFFGGRVMNELTPVDIRRYIALRRQERISDSTINRETALLSAAINYANREWDWQLPNPAKGRRLVEPEGRVRWLARAEAEALIQLAEKDSQSRQWLPEFIRLALNTGCRKQELLGLEWRRVDLQAGLIQLEGQHTKGGRRRSVPLNATARLAMLSSCAVHGAVVSSLTLGVL